MNFSKPFIERPVATTVLTIAIIILGLFAYRMLPVSELPNIDFPTIVVSANLPGADPETMANTVATPLEKNLSTIAGIDAMSSINTSGQTRIILQFNLDRDIDAAAQDVQAAISQALRQLPPELPAPPILRKVSPTAFPIIYLAMTAEHLPLSTVNEYAQTYVAQRFSMIPGVADVNIYGAQQYAVRIRLNPDALASRGLGINTVSTALQAISTHQPAGIFQTPFYDYLIKTDSQLDNAKEFNEAILASVNGTAIRLKDIGSAIDSVANDKIATWYNGKRAVVLAIQREPGSNTVAVAKAIKQILPAISNQLPGGVHLEVVYDRSNFIKASTHEVELTLIIAILLVILVIYLFLNNISSTLITCVALPISIIATFGMMYFLSYSLDNLSLMALVLAVGFVIDDAVVVLENIVRHLENGLDRFTATLRGTQEIAFTVISMTLSLVAVFIPILFLQGLLGRLFHEFAVVVAIAILFSGLIALTVTPMLCSRFLSTSSSTKNNFNALFERSRNFYIRTLAWSLDHRKVILSGFVATFILTIGLFYWVPKGFVPNEDTGVIIGTTEVQEGLSFTEFSKRQQAAANIIRKNSAVISLVSAVGQGSGGFSRNTGQLLIQLKPEQERKKTSNQVIEQLRHQLREVTGIKISLQNLPSIPFGATSISNYQYVIQGQDWQKLQKFSQLLQTKINTIKGIQDLNSDLKLNNPEIRLQILRDVAADFGITPAQIETALYTAYGGRQINSILTPTNQYQVIIEMDPAKQKNIEALNNFNFKTANGKMVPLTAIAQIKEGVGPLSVNHYGQLPAVTLSFNIAPGFSLGDITKQIEAIAHNTLPPEISGSFTGILQTFQTSLISLPILLIFTILVIYMVLAILYEHFIHPLTILTSLPLAALGALVALLLFNQQLDIFSFIGIIMLVGLVKKNGIIMVDFAIAAQRTHPNKQSPLSPREAILQACQIRYRPIMMTTMAAILATLPIALGMGAGSEMRRSLGIAVVGGLLFSQMLTLYVTPVFYLQMEKWLKKTH